MVEKDPSAVSPRRRQFLPAILAGLCILGQACLDFGQEPYIQPDGQDVLDDGAGDGAGEPDSGDEADLPGDPVDGDDVAGDDDAEEGEAADMDVPDEDVPAEVSPDTPYDPPAEDLAPDPVEEDPVVEAGEICNNNVDDNGDGRVDCMDSECLEAPSCNDTCYPIARLGCGDSLTGRNDDALSTDRIEEDSCDPVHDLYTGPEVGYWFELDDTQQVRIRLEGLSADLDVILLDNEAGRCDAARCIDRSYDPDDSDELISIDLEAGTYYILIDGFRDAVSDFTLSILCP